MKKLATISKFFLVSILTMIWIFSGWPQFFNFPPQINKSEAAINQTTYLSPTASTKITTTVSWQTVTAAPASTNIATSCANKLTVGYCQEAPGLTNTVNAQAKPTTPNGKGWIYDTAVNATIPTGTWTFNIKTTNSAIGGTGYMTVCAWKVKVSAGAISSSVNIINCVDGVTNLQANITTLYASSVSVASVPAVSLATNEYLYVEYWLHTTVASGSSTGKVIFQTNAGATNDIVLPGVSTNLAPTAPTQNTPANNATGVSVTPNFLMTATDPEVNGLGYKTTIYSNNTCATVVQTNDQAISSTGWTGTNAVCTGSPTSCYSSGTQGNYTAQTALSPSTQYWWKAAAKDPDGSGTFTNSATCNSFTTAAPQSLTFSLGSGSINMGTLSTGAPSSGSHTITVGTNASGGIAVTYFGNTLASGAKTISPCTSNCSSIPGSQQFGINAVANTTPSVGAACSGSAPIASAATNYSTANSFRFVSGDTIVSSPGTINSTTCTISYMTNITSVTAAGNYGTTLAYVITATF